MTGVARIPTALNEDAIRDACASAIAGWNVQGKRVLVIVPDNTRTAPIDVMFRVLADIMAQETKSFDVLIALGTHPPLTDDAINLRLGITAHDRAGKYARSRFMNQAWNDRAQP